jgi:hypothetical protein
MIGANYLIIGSLKCRAQASLIDIFMGLHPYRVSGISEYSGGSGMIFMGKCMKFTYMPEPSMVGIDNPRIFS